MMIMREGDQCALQKALSSQKFPVGHLPMVRAFWLSLLRLYEKSPMSIWVWKALLFQNGLILDFQMALDHPPIFPGEILEILQSNPSRWENEHRTQKVIQTTVWGQFGCNDVIRWQLIRHGEVNWTLLLSILPFKAWCCPMQCIAIAWCCLYYGGWDGQMGRTGRQSRAGRHHYFYLSMKPG